MLLYPILHDLKDIATQLMRANTIVGAVIETFYDYVEQDKSWSEVVEDGEFAESWSEVERRAEDSKNERDRLGEARRRVIKDLAGDTDASNYVNTADTYDLGVEGQFSWKMVPQFIRTWQGLEK
ncbi:hypothetical protein MMC16_004698 [Acarospora aff. strigata]|nr:hypothetical protein [Acarospora aff. strigata]